MPYPGVDNALAELARKTAAVRLRCSKGDIASLKDRARLEMAAIDRAGAFVWLAAALEQFIGDLIVAVLDELNTRSVPQADLKLPLFSLIVSPSFDRLQQVRGFEMWETRAKVFSATSETAPALFNQETLPTDGKTVRPEHFQLIWSIFGFDGQSYPSLLHRAMLTDLANTRNLVAHGHEDPEKVGRTKTAVDVERTCKIVDEFAEHACVAAEAYLYHNAYLR